MEIDYQTFITYLAEWCEKRSNQMMQCWPVNGGWELWAQIDFVAYMSKKHSDVIILREMEIYKEVVDKKGKRKGLRSNNQLAVDWLINAYAADPSYKIAVELKCLSGGVLANDKADPLVDTEPMLNESDEIFYSPIQTLISGIKKDTVKLRQDNINDQYRSCQTVVVAINFLNEAIPKLEGRTTLNCIYTTTNKDVEIWAQRLYISPILALANSTMASSLSTVSTTPVSSPGLLDSTSVFGSTTVGSSLPNAINPNFGGLGPSWPGSFGSDGINLTSGASLPGSSALNPMDLT